MLSPMPVQRIIGRRKSRREKKKKKRNYRCFTFHIFVIEDSEADLMKPPTIFPMALEWASKVGLNISCYHSNNTILGRQYFQESMFNSGNANGLATFPQVFLAAGNEWGQSAASYWEYLHFLTPPNCLPTNPQCFAFLWNRSHSWEFEIALME